MLMRTDPFAEFDRLTRQAFGQATRTSVMPMDAYRAGTISSSTSTSPASTRSPSSSTSSATS